MVTWAGLLVIKDRKVLMTKEINNDFYTLPGGKVEIGESHEKTVAREVMEELGNNVQIMKMNFFNKYVLPGKAENSIMEFNVYTGNISGKFKMNDEIEDIKWINTTDLKSGIKTGSITSLKLFPELIEKGLID
jgi:NADH pyrophosphatase NudC (nudix superfamily)